MKEKFTKKEQQEAITEIVRLINKYKLKFDINHEILIRPLEIEEAKDG